MFFVVDKSTETGQGAFFVFRLVACLGTFDKDFFGNTGVRVLPDIYTLDLGILAETKLIFDKFGIQNMEALQINVSKTNKENVFVAQPAPWIITGGAE